jgi:hypothetical protein
MNRTEYESHAGINFSLLKKFAISPAYYKWYVSQPKSEPTTELRIGLATHAMCLTPSVWHEQFAVCPKVDRRTNAGKQVWQEFNDANVGKTILTEEEYDTVCGCFTSYSSSKIHDTISKAKSIHIEKPIFSEFVIDGMKVAVKGIPDIYIEDTGTIFDLKTLGDVPTPKNMAVSMNRSDYYGQAAYYKMLLESQGKTVNEIIFGFVEKNKPHCFALATPNEYNLNNAIDRVRNLLFSYNQCKETDFWPSTDNGIVHKI